MPVCKLEYTDNLSITPEWLSDFFPQLHHMMVELIDTNLTSCKSYAAPQQNYCIADGQDPQRAFTLLSIQILPGRSDELKQQLQARAGELLSKLLQAPSAPLKVQVRVLVIEVERALYYMNELA